VTAMVKTRGRFAVEQCDGWTLADYVTAMCVSFDSSGSPCRRPLLLHALRPEPHTRGSGGTDEKDERCDVRDAPKPRERA
jgi:hypothetical protein